MPTLYYRHSNKQALTLAETPFASGGEGKLYHVIHPKGNSWVAKIYHPYKRSAERAEKMVYLQQYKPYEAQQNAAWIIDTLEDKKGNFLGIIMPHQHGRKLEVLCSTKLPRQLNDTWKVFDRGTAFAFESRLRLSLKLAVAVARLHASQLYILVDLKPDNVLVQANGGLALVDLDSVAVVEKGNLRFQASVATPEYAPPEHYQNQPALLPSWDNFSLAVILYKVLCGVHPYAATSGAPYEDRTSLGQKIEQGLFAHSPSKTQYLTVVPPPHKNFYALPQSFQQLFVQCFETGHERPEERPKASTWCWAILEALGDAALTQQFRDVLVDGWALPRTALPLASTLLGQQKNKLEGVSLLQTAPARPPIALSPSVTHYLDGTVPLKKEILGLPEKALAIGVVTLLINLGVIMTDFNPVMILWMVLLVGYTAIAFYFFYKKRFRQRRLKQLKQSYNKHSVQADLKHARLHQVWQDWQQKEVVALQQTLAQVEAEIINKDQQVQALLQARLVAYQNVKDRYQNKFERLELPELGHNRAWSALVISLKNRQKKQALAVQEALGSRAAQKAYETAVAKAETELQQLEQQLLDEARVLFDWDAFFDAQATGVPWQDNCLQKALEAQHVPHVLAIANLTWTATDDLKVNTATDSFVLERAAYQQLETFYEAYRFYLEPLAFARTHQLSDAPSFLKVRFDRLQQNYQEHLTALRDQRYAQQQAAQVPYQQALVLTEWQLEELQALIEDRQAALLDVEANYDKKYEPIKRALAQQLQVRLTIVTQFKKNTLAYWQQLQGQNDFIEVQQLLNKQAREIQHLL